jgi:hypothetical protein
MNIRRLIFAGAAIMLGTSLTGCATAHDYVLGNGHTVSVAPDAPLPAPVITSIQAKAAPLCPRLMDRTTVRAASVKLRSLASKEALATGTGIVFATLTSTMNHLAWLTTASGVAKTGVTPASSKEAIFVSGMKWAKSHDHQLVVVECFLGAE